MSNDRTGNDEIKTKVFLSYSRRDSEFLQSLAASLDARGYTSVFDSNDRPSDDPDLLLTAQDEWWTALKNMIAASDVMVFVASPASAASRVCDDEIAHARSLGKRIIGILRTTIDFNSVPERLRALNVKLDFRRNADADFANALDALCRELDVDIEWHRTGARLMRQALDWKEGRSGAQLLRYSSISAADNWRARRPPNTGEAGPVLEEFIEASRLHEKEQRDRQRRTIGRAFVKPAELAIAEGRTAAALRLAAAGAVLAEDPDLSHVPELWRAAAPAVFASPARIALRGHQGPVTDVRYSPNGAHIVTASEDKTARVWDAATGVEIARLC